MKKLYFALFSSLIALSACTGKPAQEASSTTNGEYEVNEGKTDGLQRMREYNFSDSVTIDGRLFVYSIHREASDSLPTVTDDEGTRYADNIYTLKIGQGQGEPTVYRFTKRNFMSYLSSEFQHKGILDGMMFDNSLSGLCFAVSVSLPQSDMFEPLLLRIDPKGGMSITRDERSEVELEENDDEGV